MKKTRNHSPDSVHAYRCSRCSNGTARNFPGEPIRDRGCIDCLHKRQGGLLHELRRLLTTREQQSALQRYIEVAQALAKQLARDPERSIGGRNASHAPRPARHRQPPSRLPRSQSHPMHADSRR